MPTQIPRQRDFIVSVVPEFHTSISHEHAHEHDKITIEGNLHELLCTLRQAKHLLQLLLSSTIYHHHHQH